MVGTGQNDQYLRSENCPWEDKCHEVGDRERDALPRGFPWILFEGFQNPMQKQAYLSYNDSWDRPLAYTKILWNSFQQLDGIWKGFHGAAGINKLGFVQGDAVYGDKDGKEAVRIFLGDYNDRLFRIKRALTRLQDLVLGTGVNMRRMKFYLEPHLKERVWLGKGIS